MLRLYNTLTRRIEEFKPLRRDWVGYYSCGPTVYDYAHIGHARTYVFADVLQRVLEFADYKVKRVMNITDVGHLTSDADSGQDKMELASRASGKGAQREHKSVWDIAQFYTDDFMQMLDQLHINRPDIICKATDYITSMIRMIEVLERKGFTYTISDGVYFDTTKLADYGKLTGQPFDALVKGLKAGARIEVVSEKKNPTDFALWKFSYPHGRSFDNALDDATKRRQMEWESPWGKGFPGWHIECSAMSMHFLGETFDIHTGGVDHIPIHHTNEIAQSEAVTGRPFVRFWLHGEHLLIEGEKMSKSLKNFYRIKDLEEKKYSPMALRYLFLTASYRVQLNFTWKALNAAQSALKNLYGKTRELQLSVKGSKRAALSEGKPTKKDAFHKQFTDALFDDLNTAAALAVVWEVFKSNIPPDDKLDLLYLFDEVLGLGFRQITDNKEQTTDLPDEIKKLVYERERLRIDKKWVEADKIRIEIEGRGYKIEDTEHGTKVNR